LGPGPVQTIRVDLDAGRTIAGFLSGKELLLVLDNLEQLLPAAPGIAELLDSATGLTVIATRREPLRIRGERVYPVPPLRDEEAVELFAERARAADPTFELTCGGRPTASGVRLATTAVRLRPSTTSAGPSSSEEPTTRPRRPSPRASPFAGRWPTPAP
jgi:predicted ATPase